MKAKKLIALILLAMLMSVFLLPMTGCNEDKSEDTITFDESEVEPILVSETVTKPVVKEVEGTES